MNCGNCLWWSNDATCDASDGQIESHHQHWCAEWKPRSTPKCDCGLHRRRPTTCSVCGGWTMGDRPLVWKGEKLVFPVELRRIKNPDPKTPA